MLTLKEEFPSLESRRDFISSFLDFIKLLFINSNEQEEKNEHRILHKEINLDERI